MCIRFGSFRLNNLTLEMMKCFVVDTHFFHINNYRMCLFEIYIYFMI